MPVTIASLLAAILLGFILGALLNVWMQRGRTRLEQARLNGLTAEIAQRTAERDQLRAERDLRATTIARLETENRQMNAAQETIRAITVQNQQLERQMGDLRAQLAQASSTLEAERSHSAEKLALLNDAREQLSNQFKSLANDILEEKSKRFAEQNQANLGQLLNPLKEKLGEFQQKVEGLQQEGVVGRSELKVQIDQLKTLNERLSVDANNLVNALKGSSQTQGRWGELVLESLLDSAGLREGHEYRVQASFTRDDRTRAKPDVILDLPGGRHLVIDAKVSLGDYDEYCANDDKMVREAALARHVASVRAHIRELSQRNYQSLYALKSLDFVVMFVPIEPAFMLALAHEGKLWQEAWDKNVLLVSRTTLLFVLRTVAHLWRQEQQNNNVKEIVRRGGELYDKLRSFAEDLISVGKGIDTARQSYDAAYKKLVEGKGNAIRQAEMLRALGVKPAKTLPASLVEAALDEPLELAAAAEENEQA